MEEVPCSMGESLTNVTGLERYDAVINRRRFLHRLHLNTMFDSDEEEE